MGGRWGRMAAALLILALLPGMPQAADTTAARGLEERVARMERLMQSQGLMEMLALLEQLQQEVRELRGAVEVQQNGLEALRGRQRDLYLDIDRRLRRLEETGLRPEAPAAPGAEPAPASGRGAAAQTAAAAAQKGGGEAAYRQALAILREGRYMEAAEAFRAFLAEYPGGDYADNAQYWLAETHYVTRRFRDALQAFGQVLERYPDSPKAPDARLKIGYIHYEQGNWDAARKELEAVLSRHPGSTAARLAGERLRRMRREGR